MNSPSSIYYKNYVLSLVLIIFFLLPQILSGQSKGYPVLAPKERIRFESDKKQKEKVFFPDEYSELDEQKARDAQLKSKEINDAIEQARQKYFQALILVQKRDTTRAVKYFEDALNKLNKLISLPEIEKNEDFSNLAQSILDDYENFVKSADFITEDSPAFMITELLNKEIEEIQTIPIIPEPIESSTKTINYGGLPKPPDSILIPLTEHETVDKSIKFLTSGTGKKIFKIWLERSSKWFPMMLQLAKEENMPQEIIYLSMIESGMNPNAVSSAKAVGLWQFIRTTGELYDLNSNSSIFVDERRDPEKATRAAMRHLRDLYNEFGDWHLALSAYNCGAGCVARAIKKTNKETPNFWDVRDKLPPETRAYVPKYISAAKIAMDPEKYGFSVDSLKFHNQYQYDFYQLETAVNLDAIAKAANCRVEEIKELNPELILNCTPPDKIPYTIKIPSGTKDIFAVNYAALTPEEKEPFLTHVVQNKESIKSIASRYNLTIGEICELNGISGSKPKLKKGQELRIPVNPANLASNNDSPKSAKINPDSFNKHKIQNGETLFSIARAYSMDVARLRKINNLDYKDKIIVGQSIYVEGEMKPGVSTIENINDFVAKNQSSNTDNTDKVHKVKKGETLAQIADDYNVKIDDLKKWNNLRSLKIKAGQKLKVLGSDKATTSIAKEKENRNNAVVHKVRSGETLGVIAAKYNVTEEQLKSWNEDVISGNTIFANTRLKVYSSDNNKGSSVSKPKNVNSLPKYYKIRSGDTLSEIAKKFGLTVSSLKKKNKNLDEDKLQVGKSIRLQ